MSEHNEAIEAAMTDEQIHQWISACNHEPARQVLREYIELRSLKRPDPDHFSDVGKMVGPAAIDELAALRAKATAGPWRRGQDGNPSLYGPDNSKNAGIIAKVIRGANASFIAALVNAYDTGKLTAAPAISNGPQCHPGAFWTVERLGTDGSGQAVCSVCGLRAVR